MQVLNKVNQVNTTLKQIVLRVSIILHLDNWILQNFALDPSNLKTLSTVTRTETKNW